MMFPFFGWLKPPKSCDGRQRRAMRRQQRAAPLPGARGSADRRLAAQSVDGQARGQAAAQKRLETGRGRGGWEW